MTRTKPRKRHRHDSPPRSSRDRDHRKSQKADHSSYSTSQRSASSSEPIQHRINQQETTSKRPNFASYIDTPNLPVEVKVLCEIIAQTPPLEVGRVLDDTGIRVSTDIVENVLKLSYAHPCAAVKFFRWSGYQLNDRHSPYAWNLVVDMLGKNGSFDAMWAAIKSMKKEGLLSLATFGSVFGSYVIADKVQGAFMTFEVMDQYGWAQDIVALNSLLTAICRDGKTIDAKEFLQVAKTQIRPDADTYAILLEGWENEQDAVNARQTFEEMVVEIGWDPNNVPAYDSLLNTLLKGSDGLQEAMKLFEALKDRRCYPGMRFYKAALNECITNGDMKAAKNLWGVMKLQDGCKPDIVALNSLLSAICRDGKTIGAKEFLQVAKTQIRPDADTYAILLDGWENEKDAVNARQTFEEMVEEIGWDPNNFPAYDSLLNTLLRGSDGLQEAMKLFVTLKDRRCYPGMRFYKAALHECITKGDMKAAEFLWGVMTMQQGCKPDTEMYNLMISVYSNLNNVDLAGRMLDEMVFNGVFPNSQSYNLLFQFLIQSKKLNEAQSLFNEMIKNEFVPSHANCCIGVRVFLDVKDPYTAIKIWKCLVETYETDLEETGNLLVVGLRDLNRLPEAVKYAKDIIDRGINLTCMTLSMVRQALAKAGKGPLYDDLWKKWQLHQTENPSTSTSQPVVEVSEVVKEEEDTNLEKIKLEEPKKTTNGTCPKCNNFHKGECKARQKTCFKCRKPGHLSSQCKEGRICFVCNSPDHVKADCPQDQQNGYTIGPANIKTGKIKTETGIGIGTEECQKCKQFHKGDCRAGQNTCFKCGKVGHIARECKGEVKLCFLCKSPNHVKANCPQGSK